jgi:hypothetical protein
MYRWYQPNRGFLENQKQISVHCKKNFKGKKYFLCTGGFFGPKWHSLHIDPRHPCLRRYGVQHIDIIIKIFRFSCTSTLLSRKSEANLSIHRHPCIRRYGVQHFDIISGGSVTFWCGSGFGSLPNLFLSLMNPVPDLI